LNNNSPFNCVHKTGARATLSQREREVITDLMILHRGSGAKSSNRFYLPFLRFSLSDHEPKLGKETGLAGGKCLDNHI
jgi:hypothetical protein